MFLVKPQLILELKHLFYWQPQVYLQPIKSAVKCRELPLPRFSLFMCRSLIMASVNSCPRLMVVSDLDFTMVDHHDSENLSLLRFNALWEANYRRNSLLVFSTGRSPASYEQLRKEKPLLTPDITVMSVGTEIAYGKLMVPDNDWVEFLNQNWDRNTVIEETGKFPELIPQSETEQRPHKVSFYIEKDKAEKVMKALSESLEKHGLDFKIIYSGGIALDVLPQGAGKGQALAYLLKRLKTEGKVPNNTLVCGDSGNDAELFSVPEVYGVMVSNAQEELLQWYAENAKNNPNIIHATERCAAGIIQAIGHFSLGPNTSPRDAPHFSECKPDDVNPGHEIVKFFLFYELWRHAEVEDTDPYMENLKVDYHPAGVFVHPSGVERSLHDCINAMRSCYGDKQGRKFRVWVDRVSPAQMSPDTWIVKFDKWELYGDERHCCITTVVLSSKGGDVSDGFTWQHVHQTWLEGWGVKDNSNWLF